MSQPTDRMADLAPVGDIDEERGEFWIDNPWKMNSTPYNVSGYERNQVFLQLSPSLFAEIGHLTGADSDGDGRGASVADVTGDLQPDVVVRQSGGGPLLVYANRFPPLSRLVVSLQGTKSNALGIGATVTAETGGRTLTRQMFPTTNFASSQPAQLSFGLGSADRVDKLTVRWPSGAIQTLTNVPTGIHVRIFESQPRVQVLVDARGRSQPADAEPVAGSR